MFKDTDGHLFLCEGSSCCKSKTAKEVWKTLKLDRKIKARMPLPQFGSAFHTFANSIIKQLKMNHFVMGKENCQVSRFVKVAKVDEIKPGRCIGIQPGGVFIGIYNVNGEYYAMSNICPHVGGVLHAGCLEGKMISCPIHQWQFDVTTGKCLWPVRKWISIYPVKVEGEDILVDINSPQFSEEPSEHL